METSVLQEVVGKHNNVYLQPTVSLRHDHLDKLPFEYVVSHPIIGGVKAFMFHKQGKLWLWSPSTVHKNNVVSTTTPNADGRLSVFVVMYLAHTIYITDILIYNNMNVVNVGYIHRIEVARKWVSQQDAATLSIAQCTVPMPCRSAYKNTTVRFGQWTLMVRDIYPSVHSKRLFLHAGLVFTPMMYSYKHPEVDHILTWDSDQNTTVVRLRMSRDSVVLALHHGDEVPVGKAQPMVTNVSIGRLYTCYWKRGQWSVIKQVDENTLHPDTMSVVNMAKSEIHINCFSA